MLAPSMYLLILDSISIARASAIAKNMVQENRLSKTTILATPTQACVRVHVLYMQSRERCEPSAFDGSGLNEHRQSLCHQHIVTLLSGVLYTCSLKSCSYI